MVRALRGERGMLGSGGLQGCGAGRRGEGGRLRCGHCRVATRRRREPRGGGWKSR